MALHSCLLTVETRQYLFGEYSDLKVEHLEYLCADPLGSFQGVELHFVVHRHRPQGLMMVHRSAPNRIQLGLVLATHHPQLHHQRPHRQHCRPQLHHQRPHRPQRQLLPQLLHWK